MALVDERFAKYGESFNSREQARESGRAHVICLGDSHLNIFRRDLPQENAAKLLPQVWFDPCIAVGATARGLVNPFSRTNARNVFRRRLELAEGWQPLVFQLGEVDCGFLIWYRAEADGEPVETQLEQSIDSYLAFISDVREQGFADVYVLSAPLPTVEHGHDWAGDTHARRLISVPQRDRTELTVRFNAEMARRAGEYTFVDASTATLDPATGLIKSEFVNPDATDHHLAPEPYSRVVAELLGPLLRPA